MNPDTSGPASPAITALKSAMPLCCAQTAVPPTNVNHGMVAPEVATIPVNATSRTVRPLEIRAINSPANGDHESAHAQ